MIQFPFAGLLRPCRFILLAVLLFSESCAPARADDPLVDYVSAPDDSFKFTKVEEKDVDDYTAIRFNLTSQTWRGHAWTHQVVMVRPPKVRNSDIALVLVSGDGDAARTFSLLKTLAGSAGAIAAAVNRVPNQPLYEGRKEDALIAYTYEQYLKTGDKTWPLLLPMAKSAVRTMDLIQSYAGKEFNQNVKRFVVTGASKRGWTTWLSAAADKRVVAIAPMVIDMLNMRAQVQWAKKMYGQQSEEIQDYTEYNFDQRMDEPGMVELRKIVDPYSYRDRYTLPKLLLLGTNDPYWVVDSLRHYWNDLPEPKLIFQTPNAGHDLGGGKEAAPTLAAFYAAVADRHTLPTFTWSFTTNATGAGIEVKSSVPVKEFRLWTATSADRDFRDEKWSSEVLEHERDTAASAKVESPKEGFRAFMVEVELSAPSGQTYRISTEARVTPDGPPAAHAAK